MKNFELSDTVDHSAGADEIDELGERYRPLIEWCELRLASGRSAAEQRHAHEEFFRALDKVIRDADFSAQDVGMVLGQYWGADPGDPDVFEHINSYCMDAAAVRSYIEALGQAQMRGVLGTLN